MAIIHQEGELVPGNPKQMQGSLGGIVEESCSADDYRRDPRFTELQKGFHIKSYQIHRTVSELQKGFQIKSYQIHRTVSELQKGFQINSYQIYRTLSELQKGFQIKSYQIYRTVSELQKGFHIKSHQIHRTVSELQKGFQIKVFIPQFTSGLRVSLLGCRTGVRTAESCPLLLRLRAKAPPLHNSSSQDCTSSPSVCQLLLGLPLWQHWYYVLVERTGMAGTAIYFQLTTQLQDCSRPGLSRGSIAPSSSLNMPQSFGAAGGLASLEGLPAPGVSLSAGNMSWGNATILQPSCWPIRPTLRNELDTFSVHFYIFFGPNVSVPPDRPAVFSVNLLPVLDSGGVLNLEIRLNISSVQGENVTVFGCLNHGVPLISGDNSSITCQTDSLSGFSLAVNSSNSMSRLRIPYPQTGTWYLSLRSMCSSRNGWRPCRNISAELNLRTFLSPCINECGTYGQCKLLRTNNYLYAACECRAGWSGWGCTDNAQAFTYGFQLLSTLLLCLSNLMFLPPVLIALRGHYLLEASVYIFTMFFSTFYHACDQPEIAVFCILGGGGLCIRTFRTIRRRHCYPPTWKRWLFYLCPGTLIASSAVALYAFVETEENYFYIHSIWHMLIAGSVGFLLPPRAKPDGRVAPLARRKGCGYQLCVNEQEELGLVDPGSVSINSICTS
ncbi:transmembrane protein 8B-like [Mantella aurantiaca]